MTEDTIEFQEGAGQSDIAPGTYLVTLTEISEPRTQLAKVGPNAGQEFTLRDWTFATDDGIEVRDSASVSRSPRSKAYKWVTALLGGTPAPIGEPLKLRNLIGREAIATIVLNDQGWPKIDNLSARPRARAQQPVPAAAAAAPRPRTAGAAAPVLDDLPF